MSGVRRLRVSRWSWLPGGSVGTVIGWLPVFRALLRAVGASSVWVSPGWAWQALISAQLYTNKCFPKAINKLITTLQ